MTQIAIYGASRFVREAAWLVESCTDQNTKYEVACFIDDTEKKKNFVRAEARDKLKNMQGINADFYTGHHGSGCAGP